MGRQSSIQEHETPLFQPNLAASQGPQQVVYKKSRLNDNEGKPPAGLPTVLPLHRTPIGGGVDSSVIATMLPRLDNNITEMIVENNSGTKRSRDQPTIPELPNISDTRDNEPEVTEYEPFFTGNVAQEIDNLWDQCETESGANRPAEVEALMLWSAMSAVAPPMASRSNRRRMTTYGQKVEGDIPPETLKDNVTSSTSTHKHQERAPNSTQSRTVTSTDRMTKRTFALSARAAEFGKKIMFDYKRVLGMLEGGSRNRKWVVAVCRWILRQRNFENAVSKWRDLIGSGDGFPDRASNPIACRIRETMKLWANQKEDLTDFEPHTDAKQPPTTAETVIDTPDNEDCDLGSSFVKVLSFSPMAATLKARSTCPFCVYAELAGIAGYNAKAQDPNHKAWTMEDERFNDYIQIVRPRYDSNSWVEACARAHNREMHSTNGNIDRVTNFSRREQLMAAHRAQMWDMPVERTYDDDNVGTMVQKSFRNNPLIFFTDQTQMGTQAPTIVGTLHQYVCKADTLQQAIDDRLRAVAGAGAEVVDVDGLESSADNQLPPADHNISAQGGSNNNTNVVRDDQRPTDVTIDNSMQGGDNYINTQPSPNDSVNLSQVSSLSGAARIMGTALLEAEAAARARKMDTRKRMMSEIFSQTSRRLLNHCIIPNLT